ncbi:ADAMTS-like protein 5 [Babylonia areolata]|uniref:ADAMTS-like protein 5 n=1 Tax=Babylonia areolata TaxID=304850 RepID=UPI003FD292E6
MKRRVFHFCDSDFVTQMMINGKRYVNGETRYDVTIMKSYKARMQLLSREYLWAPNLCDCPRLRTRRSYVIMGFMQRHLDRELKLIVTPTAYVRRYSAKQHKRMLKLKDFVKC